MRDSDDIRSHVFLYHRKFFEITYDIKTLREHAHAFAKEECRKMQRKSGARMCFAHSLLKKVNNGNGLVTIYSL